jgi:predicted TPR repeat methyltransferase
VGARALLVESVLPTVPDLTGSGTFDAVVSTFDGLNYLTPADLTATLTALAPQIRPGGWLVFDVHGEATADFLRAHPVLAGEDAGRSFTLTSTVADDGSNCTTTIELTAPDASASFTESHTQFLHRTSQLHSLLTEAGFEVIDVVDEYTSTPAGEATLRATWIAKRSA